MYSAKELSRTLQAVASPEKAVLSLRFFKAGPGQYSEGDKFLGITTPQVRAIVKLFPELPLSEIEKLLKSSWHEERLAALLIMVGQYRRTNEVNKELIYDFYLQHAKYVNNWDLVDSSAAYIVGPYLENRPEKMKILKNLADSKLLWERRIAILATFHYIKRGRAEEALAVCEKLLDDKHDLIQKAVGWMLREVGKRVSKPVLMQFLDQHAATMPRTTLRYAIEHFSLEQRTHYLELKNQAVA